jgi:ribosomal protein S18 acetylase RimI-like enzyme
MTVPAVTLVVFTDEHHAAFIEEAVADYAVQQIREAGWPPDEAEARARKALVPELERDWQRADSEGHRLWTVLNGDGACVGWLWVTPPRSDTPPESVFLEQIMVREAFRRQGYGRAMMAALEQKLAGEAVPEVYLHVFDANEPARRLYASAGYETVARYTGKRRLRKSLAGA